MAESVFQRALRLLYERRLEQLGLSGSVSVTERDPGDGGPAPAAVTVTERKGGQPAGPTP